MHEVPKPLIISGSFGQKSGGQKDELSFFCPEFFCPPFSADDGRRRNLNRSQERQQRFFSPFPLLAPVQPCCSVVWEHSSALIDTNLWGRVDKKQVQAAGLDLGRSSVNYVDQNRNRNGGFAGRPRVWLESSACEVPLGSRDRHLIKAPDKKGNHAKAQRRKGTDGKTFFEQEKTELTEALDIASTVCGWSDCVGERGGGHRFEENWSWRAGCRKAPGALAGYTHASRGYDS